MSVQPTLEALRPLRHPLRKGDQIFFLHIPKTAGTSVNDILRLQVNPGEFFSFPDKNILTPDMSIIIQKAKIVRGHRMYDLQQFFTRRPHVMTMLRNPYDRVISNYAHLKRTDQSGLLSIIRQVDPDRGDEPVTLEEYISAPSSQNRMIRYLVGFNRKLNLLPDDERLTLAKIHLEGLAFFGLKERFDDSMQLLAYTFCWREFKKYDTLNTAPSDSKPPLSPEVRAALEAGNALDMQLYQYACELFDYRFQHMERELKGEPR